MANYIFDLDGTLVDTAPGIDASVQAALAQAAPDVTFRTMAPFIGPPLRPMLAAAYPQLAPEVLERVALAFREIYDRDGWRGVRPFPGATDVLDALAAAGHRLFIATVKPAVPAASIVEATGLRTHVQDLICPDSVTPPFPDKAASVAELMRRHGLVAAETTLIGDGTSDRDAARANGLRFFAALYGFGGLTPEDGTAGALSDLRDLLAELDCSKMLN